MADYVTSVSVRGIRGTLGRQDKQPLFQGDVVLDVNVTAPNAPHGRRPIIAFEFVHPFTTTAEILEQPDAALTALRGILTTIAQTPLKEPPAGVIPLLPLKEE